MTHTGTGFVDFNYGTSLYLDYDQTWTVNGTSRLSVYGDISTGGDGRTLTKAGSGTLVLGGSSSFSGGVIVTGGTLLLANDGSRDGSIYGPAGNDPIKLNSGTTFGSADGDLTVANVVSFGNNVTFKTDDSDLNFEGLLVADSGNITLNVSSGTFVEINGGLQSEDEGTTNLTIAGGGTVLVDSSSESSTSSSIASITANGTAVIFVDQEDLPTALAATNNGYIGMVGGFAGGSYTEGPSPHTLISRIVTPNSFAGTIGFETDPDSLEFTYGEFNEFGGNINLGGFNHANFRGLATFTAAVLDRDAVITAPSNGVLQLSALDDGLFNVRSYLLTSHGVDQVVIGRTDGRGDGTVVLDAENDYTGGTLLQSGTLLLAESEALGTGDLTIPVGAITPVFGATGSDRTVANNIVINHTGLVIANEADEGSISLTLSGIISGTGANLTITDESIVTLTGNNTFGGGLTVQDGSRVYIETNTGAGTGELKVENGTVVFNSDRPVIGGLSGEDTCDCDPVILNGHESGGDSLVTTLVINQNFNSTYAGDIHGDYEYGTGNLEKQGTGLLTLTGSNTYGGTTTILGGGLMVYSLANGGFTSGIGNSSSEASNLILDGGGLGYGGGTVSTDRLFTLGTNGGGFRVTSASTLTFSATGSVALAGTDTARSIKFVVEDALGKITFNPVLVNNGTGKTSLVKDGLGTLQLQGANTYTGDTWIKGGTLKVFSTSLSNLTAVIVDAGAKFAAHDAALALGSLSGAGTVQLEGASNGSSVLTVGADNTSTTFSGMIDADEYISLVKVGTGTLTLNGNNNYGSLTGLALGTTINGGMIIAGHNHALGSGSITLNGGGLGVANGVTLTNPLIFSGTAIVLGGNGTFGTHITADNHVVLSPGNSPGTLTFNAGLTLASGSAISFQVQNATGAAGTGYDLISVTGGVLNLTAPANTITFNILSLNGDGNTGNALNFNPSASYSWTFASSPNANITGFDPAQFHLVNGFTNALSGGQFSVSQGLDQRTLLLNFTPVPEPSTWLLLGSGLGALALRLRRRRN